MPDEQFLSLTQSDLIKILSKGTHTVEVKKADGSDRTFLDATLDTFYLPSEKSVDQTIDELAGLITFWSVSDNGFRKFKTNSVISIGL